jgi:hypothetical protein
MRPCALPVRFNEQQNRQDNSGHRLAVDQAEGTCSQDKAGCNLKPVRHTEIGPRIWFFSS